MRSKNYQVYKYEIPPIFLVLLATLYFIIGGIIINGSIQIFAFLVIILSSVLFYHKTKVNFLDFMWIISVIPFLYCMRRWNIAGIRDFVAYLTFVIFVVNVKTEIRFFNRAIKLIFYMAIFHLIMVFVNVIFKSQFTNFIYSIIDSGAVSTYNRAVNGNYITGFGYIPGDTSGYLVNGIFILLFGDKVVEKKHKLSYIALLFLGVLFCAKKSHLLCLIFTCMVLWMISSNGSKRIKKIITSIFILCFALVILYLLLPFLSHIPMVNRILLSIDKMMAGVDFSSNRTGLSKLAFRLFNENKTFGIGWKEFNRYTYELWGNTNYVNNVFLQLATETGIVGFVLFSMPIVVSLFKTIKMVLNIKKNEENNDIRMKYLTLSLAFQLFYVFYCFFEIPFYDYTFLFIYAIAISIFNSISRFPINKNEQI